MVQIWFGPDCLILKIGQPVPETGYPWRMWTVPGLKRTVPEEDRLSFAGKQANYGNEQCRPYD
jgi:hypothetical protein